jgi:Integrase core domain.
MGHIGVKGLKHAVEGLKFSDKASGPCDICARANIKKSPFPLKSETHATEILERVHSDVCGPFSRGYGGFRYFITLLDDYTSWGVVYFMKKKSETPQNVILYVKSYERIHKTKIRILRVDNAPEYVEGFLRQFCEQEGITYERTVPEAHQQNGKAERHNLTYETMARAMLLDADLHDWFWPFAVLCAVYIKNRVPHSALPTNVTPFERWVLHKPNISHMRPFGSHCTSRVVNEKFKKLELRGETGRFLGYAPESKGYLFWHTASRTVKIRRDLVFHGPPSPTIGQGGVDLSIFPPFWPSTDVDDEDQDKTKIPSADTMISSKKPRNRAKEM